VAEVMEAQRLETNSFTRPLVAAAERRGIETAAHPVAEDVIVRPGEFAAAAKLRSGCGGSRRRERARLG